MQVTSYTDIEAFWTRCSDLLTAAEAANGLPLGIVLYARRYPLRARDIYLSTVEDAAGNVQLIGVHTPPRDLVLLAAPGDPTPAVAALIGELWATSHPLPGITAAQALARCFVREWQAASGQPALLVMAQRIFILHQVIPVSGVAGRLRRATPDDGDLLAGWFDAFDKEALAGTPNLSAAQEFVNAAIEREEFYVWEVAGQAVTMAKSSRPLLHGITVSAVYTPPALRGNGYASACVAALSQHLLDSGWRFCTLFTDVANPTSNKIYQHIGYRPIADWENWRFGL